MSAPRYRVQFTADPSYVELLEEARNLLQHELPTRDLLEVQRRALELLVQKLRQRKYAAPRRPRATAPKPSEAGAATKVAAPEVRAAPRCSNRRRDIRAAVRRSVWSRDEGRCTYLDTRGQRCREQAGLEFHHQHPHAHGGPPSAENLTLRCRSHNALAAEQDFGREFVLEKRAGRAKEAALQ